MPTCKTCGKGFRLVQHMRSHQSRTCSVPEGNESDADPAMLVAEFVAATDDALTDALPSTLQEESAPQGPAEVYGITHFDDNPHAAILQQLDLHTRVADDIGSFYNCLTQSSDPVITSPPSIMEHVNSYPPYVRAFIEKCSHISLTKTSITAMYEVFMTYEAGLPEQYRLVSEHISSLPHLHSIIKGVREHRLFKEGWRRCRIDLNDLHFRIRLNLPINTTGTYRCPLVFLRKQLDELGASSIKQYQRSEDCHGRRTYSNPCDSGTLEIFCELVGTRGLVLCVDIYCDGIALPNGGSQTISPLRMRFSNVAGIETAWFEIGLCPTLRIGNTMCSSGLITDLRSELLHRYLFMVLRPLIDASKMGLTHDAKVIYPRLFMVLSDQKQERPLVGLKSSNSTRDCTACDMLSRLTSSEAAARGLQPEAPQPLPSTTTQTESSEASDQRQDSDGHSTDNDASGSDTARPQRKKRKRRKKAERSVAEQLCLKIQLDSNPGSKRSLVRALGVQLILALDKIKDRRTHSNPLWIKLRQVLPAFWFDRTKSELDLLRQYAMQYSCIEFPPSIAPFHGIGTEPFLMYDSIAFDSLHVMDLGILRVFPDSCFIHFSAEPNFTSLPTTQCIAVANSRLKLIPRGVHVPKTPLFIGKEKEQLAGVTGLLRRKSTPFLWLCVLGLNTKLTPDTDPLVQTALQLNDIHCKLLGTNEDSSAVHRSDDWISTFQKDCFNIGRQLTSLFGIKVNTKLHRVMRHVGHHLRSFGTARWGATDQNETQHKSLKVAYKQTNRQPHCLEVQLLKGGYAHSSTVHTPASAAARNQSTVAPTTTFNGSGTDRSTRLELNANRHLLARLDRIVSLRYSDNRSRVWCTLSYITLQNNFSWDVKITHQHVMTHYTYRPWYTSHDNVRMDACVYKVNGVTKYGFIQLILRTKKYGAQTFLVLRRLQHSPCSGDNTLASLKYKHERLQYGVNQHGGLQLDFISTSDVQFPAFVVVDPTVLVQTFNVLTTNVHTLETEEHRLLSRFFKVHGVPLTSFREHLVHDDDPDSNQLLPVSQ